MLKSEEKKEASTSSDFRLAKWEAFYNLQNQKAWQSSWQLYVQQEGVLSSLKKNSKKCVIINFMYSKL